MTTKASKKVTQSYRLFRLFKRKRAGGVTVEQMAKATGLKPAYMGSYLTELKRVYGASITYHGDKSRYTLDNKIDVPPRGMAGRRPTKVARRSRARTRRPAARHVETHATQ